MDWIKYPTGFVGKFVLLRHDKNKQNQLGFRKGPDDHLSWFSIEKYQQLFGIVK